MSKPKILIQLDPDPQASTFDSVVAIDCGIDHLQTRSGVTVEQVKGLVHGAMFTRGLDDLNGTAFFFGGSNVVATEELVQRAENTFFGPVRVSYMSDPNGSNTTAVAAVLCAQKHIEKVEVVTILGGTGPVGQRIARLVSPMAEQVRVCSRTQEKAESICKQISENEGLTNLRPIMTSDSAEYQIALHGSHIVFAAGAAGIELAPEGWMEMHSSVQVAIDLNAVPPMGLAGVAVMDKAKHRGDVICYGAIGVGGTKMKIHKRCIKCLFESNDHTLDTMEIFEVGKELMSDA